MHVFCECLFILYKFKLKVVAIERTIPYITPSMFFHFVDISKVQDDEVGDGTTSVVVFACELLKVSVDMFDYYLKCSITWIIQISKKRKSSHKKYLLFLLYFYSIINK